MDIEVPDVASRRLADLAGVAAATASPIGAPWGTTASSTGEEPSQKGGGLGKIRISADGGSGVSVFATPERAIGPPVLAARQAWFVGET